jgi:hypothetical protein
MRRQQLGKSGVRILAKRGSAQSLRKDRREATGRKEARGKPGEGWSRSLQEWLWLDDSVFMGPVGSLGSESYRASCSCW